MLLCAGWLAFAPAAEAHPHAWIDLQTHVVLDDSGRIEALDLSWLFDEWYTAIISEEFDGAGMASPTILKDLGRQNLENLRDYEYFTEVSADGEPVTLDTVTDYETDMVDDRLRMRFTVPLETPIDPGTAKVAVRVFDPSYYIEIVYVEEEKDQVRFSGKGAEGCTAKVTQPNPSFEAVSLASALDQNQSGGNDLGKLFAETLEIHCR